jgi:hypothetical protein
LLGAGALSSGILVLLKFKKLLYLKKSIRRAFNEMFADREFPHQGGFAMGGSQVYVIGSGSLLS